jgi:transposase
VEFVPLEEVPAVIALDKYTGATTEGKYQLIIADAVTKEPLDISAKALKAYD